MTKRVGVALLAAVLLLPGCDDDKKVSGKPRKAAAEKPKPKPGPTQHFRSRPDLQPPVVKVDVSRPGTAPGYIFLAPKMVVKQAGPLIMDDRGEVVWFKPLNTKGVTDFRVQRYRGKPVLTWWRGKAIGGVGIGSYVIYDDSYRLLAKVRAGHGLTGDVHEFLITPRNTALMTIYHRMPVDLSSVGGPKEGKIWEGVVQELDIASGRVLFEWHSYPEVGLKESYDKPPSAKKGAKAPPYDYFHVNSIAEDEDGNLIVSARNTHAVYKLDRARRKILWRLGGKQSDYKLGRGARFAWQHDARRQPDGTLTIFDNGAAPKVEPFSRVLTLRLDDGKKTATLVRSFAHPKKLLVPFEGNAQFLPNGNVLVCWGARPYISEHDRSGRLLLDMYFGHGKPPLADADTYRAYRFVWHGRPTRRPAVEVGGDTLYVSWNGATEVAKWQLLTGKSRALQPGAVVAKRGFETALRPLPPDAKYVAVRALDRRGRTLATSATVRR